MVLDWRNLARLGWGRDFGSCNGGWAYDAYPELETLDSGRCITIAEIEGPAAITSLHSTRHFLGENGLTEGENRALAARGVILEIYYDGIPEPAVRVPLADFFADGCGGRAEHFSTPFVEKAPESYNCFVPMPFEGSARVTLKNDTPHDLMNYSYVEFERLPSWEGELGYLHATWDREAFQLHGGTDRRFFHVDGRGHLLGRSWSICTDEPLFGDFHFVMEGNNEFRLDGEEEMRADYLGTEDSFGFSWGFRRPFAEVYSGMNFVQNGTPSMLSIYRFRGANVIRFSESLDLRIDWSNEFRSNRDFQRDLGRLHEAGRGWVDYATTFYWYQEEPGFRHGPLPELTDRVKNILHPNPID